MLIRIFGATPSDEHRDELEILTDAHIDDHETHDAHNSDELAVFEKLALLLCNEDVFVPNDLGQEEAIFLKNDDKNIECNQMWDKLDLNDPDDFVKVRAA